MLSVVALTAMPATASAGTPAITFDIQLFDPCLRGSGAADATISVVWRDSNGALKASGTATHPFQQWCLGVLLSGQRDDAGRQAQGR